MKFKYYCTDPKTKEKVRKDSKCDTRAPDDVELIAVDVEEVEYTQKAGMLLRRLDGI